MKGLAVALISVAFPLVTCGQALGCCGDFLDAGASASAQSRPAPAARPGTVQERAASLGLHAVTAVYVATSVVTSGDTTTFSALTERQNAGTYAKRVASTGTGQATHYDALSFNARPAMSDGSLVAGDYYANYVVRGGALVFDRFVFFADDAETRRRASSARPPASVPTPAPLISIPAQAPVPVAAPAPSPAVATPPSTPAVREPRPAPSAPQPASPPRQREVRAGMALAAQADPLARIEVLRGRRITLWMRATVDGSPARVIDWRLASGELTVLGPVSGRGDDPLLASWTQLPRPGSTYRVAVDVRVDVSGSSPRTVRATIEVAVRSPAIVE